MSKTLGAQIRAARKAAGKTQQEVADQLGVSVQAVSQWETDKTSPNSKNLIDLSRVVGLKIDHDSVPALADYSAFSSSYENPPVSAPLVSWDRDPEQWKNLPDPEDWQNDPKYLPDQFIQITWKPVGDVFALPCKGGFMSPIFQKGDLVIIDTGRAPERGDYVVAQLDRSGEVLLATFVPKGVDANRAPIFDLVFASNARDSKTVDSSNPGRIIGTVREHRRYYRTEPGT